MVTREGGMLQKSRPLNDSQLSLQSDRSNKYNMNIGIPHNDHLHHHVNYLPAVNGHLQGMVQQPKANFKMPMNLEDLDDLLKYADEQNEIVTKQKRQDLENGNEVDELEGEEEEEKIKPKELLTAKGSNNSIGQISNMCSSGYQSITTQSQSSSPIESSHDYLKNGRHQPPHRNGPLKYQFGGTKATATAVLTVANNINNNSTMIVPTPKIVGPSSIHSSQKSSSLTPSSSEERLSGDLHFQNSRHHNNGGAMVNGSKAIIGEIRGESELNMVTSTLNTSSGGNGLNGGSRMNGNRRNYGRTPRTNPLFYNGTVEREGSNRSKVEDLDESLAYSPNENSLGHHNMNSSSGSNRFQRRLSLESARTLSDSSTDTEGRNLNRLNQNSV